MHVAPIDILTSHFYWVGAIPAMAFVGVFMMPFYYGSRARVPEYLKLRFDEKTRGSQYVSLRRADSEASVTRAMSRESRVLASSEFWDMLTAFLESARGQEGGSDG